MYYTQCKRDSQQIIFFVCLVLSRKGRICSICFSCIWIAVLCNSLICFGRYGNLKAGIQRKRCLGRGVLEVVARFPLGNDIFTEIRQNGDYYVDKTRLVEGLLKESFKANLITRPRRFGKTLIW